RHSYPSIPRAKDTGRPKNPNTEVSTVHRHKARSPMRRGPSNSPRPRSSNSQVSRCNCPREPGADRIPEEAAEVAWHKRVARSKPYRIRDREHNSDPWQRAPGRRPDLVANNL